MESKTTFRWGYALQLWALDACLSQPPTSENKKEKFSFWENAFSAREEKGVVIFFFFTPTVCGVSAPRPLSRHVKLIFLQQSKQSQSHSNVDFDLNATYLKARFKNQVFLRSVRFLNTLNASSQFSMEGSKKVLSLCLWLCCRCQSPDARREMIYHQKKKEKKVDHKRDEDMRGNEDMRTRI